MVFFLYGPDTFRSRQKLNEIIAKYKEVHSSGLHFSRFDARTEGIDDFKRRVETVSMFREKKLIVVRSALSSKPFQEAFLEYSKKTELTDDKEIMIIFFEGPLEKEKQSAFFKALSVIAKTQEFLPLTGAKLRMWVGSEFASLGTDVSPAVATQLIEYIGNDLWRLRNEIRKLVSYSRRPTEKDVVTLVKPRIETNIFATIDAFAARNKKEALRLLHGHLEEGAAVPYLLSMLAYQVKNLLMMKDMGERKKADATTLGKMLKLHPFVVKKSYIQAQKFTLPELKKIYRLLHEVDKDVRLGRKDPKLALELLVFTL